MTLSIFLTLLVLFIIAPALVLAVLHAAVKDFQGDLDMAKNAQAQGPAKGYRA